MAGFIYKRKRHTFSRELKVQQQRDDYIILYLYGNAPGEIYRSHTRQKGLRKPHAARRRAPSQLPL